MEFVDRQDLMILPVRIVVPFAVLKAIVGQIITGEGNGELGGGINFNFAERPKENGN